jgi:hypothetical protein
MNQRSFGRLISGAATCLLLTACMPIQPVPPAKPASAPEGIVAERSDTVDSAFDLVHTSVFKEGDNLVFQEIVAGEAGSVQPTATGQLAGAEVLSYVWPTSLDSATVGFAAEQGILALAVTAHPDFDDTPLVDEDADGEKGNDGRLWHSHWVVLVQDNACGEGALKVKDISAGETPPLPATWPELPLLIDSPNYALKTTGDTITVHVPAAPFATAAEFHYDGVTAGLQVHADLHNPLLCVTDVFDIASGDLSLPGTVR